LTDWDFLAIERVLRDARTSDASYRRLLQLLRSAGSRMFRVWSQSRVLLLSTLLLAMVGVALVGIWLFDVADLTQATPVRGWMVLAAIALAIPLAFPLVREHVGRVSIGLLSLILWIPAQFHLLVIDRVFLLMGRLDRLR
jgi:hypothetical protein